MLRKLPWGSLKMLIRVWLGCNIHALVNALLHFLQRIHVYGPRIDPGPAFTTWPTTSAVLCVDHFCGWRINGLDLHGAGCVRVGSHRLDRLGLPLGFFEHLDYGRARGTVRSRAHGVTLAGSSCDEGALRSQRLMLLGGLRCADLHHTCHQVWQ